MGHQRARRDRRVPTSAYLIHIGRSFSETADAVCPRTPLDESTLNDSAQLGNPIVEGLAAHFADRWAVVSTAFAVPVFAFFSAGVAVGGFSGLLESLQSTVALGIIGGLVIGKVVGIAGITFLLTRLRGIAIDASLRWADIIGVAFVCRNRIYGLPPRRGALP